MKRKFLVLLSILIMASLVIVGCGKKDNNEEKPAEENTQTETAENTEENKEEENKDAQNFEGKTLNVVATSDSYVPLFDKFTEKTGAKVEFLSMSSGEVISRTKAEGKPMADLWFGGGLDAFMAARDDGLLENYTSDVTATVPEEYKDKDGAYISKGITVVGFIVNNAILEEKGLEAPKTWKDLADPKYEHLVIMSNPAISGTNYAALKGLLDIYGEEEGWKVFEGINHNIDFYSKRGKDPQEKTVQGDAIFKGSENVDVAKAFIDFMLSEDAQKMIAEIDGKDSNQLIVPGIQGYDLGLPKDRLVKEDLSTFGSDRERILEKFNEISKGKTEDK